MSNRHMKGCLTSLIRKIQIKTTMRYHLIPVRVAIHKQINNQQLFARLWRKGNPSVLLVGMQTDAASVKNSMESPQKTKNGTAFDPAIALPCIYPKKPKALT